MDIHLTQYDKWLLSQLIVNVLNYKEWMTYKLQTPHGTKYTCLIFINTFQPIFFIYIFHLDGPYYVKFNLKSITNPLTCQM